MDFETVEFIFKGNNIFSVSTRCFLQTYYKLDFNKRLL